MKKVYENKYGVRIEIINNDIKDTFGNELISWKYVKYERCYCNPKVNFEKMLKNLDYKEV